MVEGFQAPRDDLQPAPTTMADKELIERCLAGDADAAQSLYSQYAPFVMAFLVRSGLAAADADDLTQETFVRDQGPAYVRSRPRRSGHVDRGHRPQRGPQALVPASKR